MEKNHREKYHLNNQIIISFLKNILAYKMLKFFSIF